MWSPHFLRQKWRELKASYDADGVMCHRGQHIILSCFSFPLHVLDRCRTSPHNPGFRDKTSVYAHWRHAHTSVALSVFYLLQYLKGSLGMRVIVFRPDSHPSLVHITHPSVRMPIFWWHTSFLVCFTLILDLFFASLHCIVKIPLMTAMKEGEMLLLL